MLSKIFIIWLIAAIACTPFVICLCKAAARGNEEDGV